MHRHDASISFFSLFFSPSQLKLITVTTRYALFPLLCCPFVISWSFALNVNDFSWLCLVHHTGILVSILECWLQSSCEFKEWQICTFIVTMSGLSLVTSPTYQPNPPDTNRLQIFRNTFSLVLIGWNFMSQQRHENGGFPNGQHLWRNITGYSVTYPIVSG